MLHTKAYKKAGFPPTPWKGSTSTQITFVLSAGPALCGDNLSVLFSAQSRLYSPLIFLLCPAQHPGVLPHRHNRPKGLNFINHRDTINLDHTLLYSTLLCYILLYSSTTVILSAEPTLLHHPRGIAARGIAAPQRHNLLFQHRFCFPLPRATPSHPESTSTWLCSTLLLRSDTVPRH